jgi:hypothetical protein
MEIPTPENAEEILKRWPKWFLLEGKVYTRHPSTGWRVEGTWICCEHCGEEAPTYKSNAKRFCKQACRNAGMVGEQSGHWTGGRQKQSNGYVRVQVGRNRRMLEHRYVMEQMLRRPLKKNEYVHHKNGRRDDNRPENLELWVGVHHQPGASEKHCPTCTCFEH